MRFCLLLCALLLAACQADAPEATAEQRTVPESPAEPAATVPVEAAATVPGDTDETAPYSEIAADEELFFTGTEPFWAGEVGGGSLTYKTPENQDGTTIRVERFAGRGGIAFSGLLDGAHFEMTVTPLACSDGMSDRTYPFTVTLEIGEDRRNGCAWSERHPFEGPEHP
jgi:uncharacterized membrane protein